MSQKEAFFGEYDYLERLGDGGFATVYKVRHRKFGDVRALKVLNTPILNGEADEHYCNFLKECKKLLMLGSGGHPNIVRIHRPSLCEQRAFVEMDYIRGCTVENYIKDNNSFVPVDEVITMLTHISSALSFCHVDIYQYCLNRNIDNLPDDPNDGSKVVIDDAARERLINKYGIIHNDMHSRNIMRHVDGRYILLDFGLSAGNSENNRMSRIKMGAIEFKAPEKWEGQGLTPQVDIYGLGIILYEFLTGRVPFPFVGDIYNLDDIQRLKEAHCTETPPPIFPLRKQAYETANPSHTMDAPDYPQWLEDLVMKCLAKKPEERFGNGKQLWEYVNEKLKQSDKDYAGLIEQNDKVKEELERVKKELEDELDIARQRVSDIKKEYEQKLKDESAGNMLAKQQLEVEIAKVKAHIRRLQDERDPQIRVAQEEVELLKKKIRQQKQESEVRIAELEENYRREVARRLRENDASEVVIDTVVEGPIISKNNVRLVTVEPPINIVDKGVVVVDDAGKDHPRDIKTTPPHHTPQPYTPQPAVKKNRFHMSENVLWWVVVMLLIVGLALVARFIYLDISQRNASNSDNTSSYTQVVVHHFKH